MPELQKLRTEIAAFKEWALKQEKRVLDQINLSANHSAKIAGLEQDLKIANGHLDQFKREVERLSKLLKPA